MIYLTNTTDLIDMVTSSAAALDTLSSWIDATTTTLAVAGSGRTGNNISSASTTTLVGSPASSTTRTLKQLTVRNKDASLSCDCTVRFNANGTIYELHKVTLQPGWTLIYIEGVGFFVITPVVNKSGIKNVSTSDQVLATAATYLGGSAILLPNPVPAGLVLRWQVSLGKSANGTATSAAAIYFGTNGTTGDTSRCATGALDTETAAADEALDTWIATVRGPIGASCIVQSEFVREDNLTTTGFSNTARKAQVKAVQSSAFDITPAGTIAGLVYTMGNNATIRQVTAEMLVVGN